MSKYWIGKSEYSSVVVLFAGNGGILIDESESTEFINPKGWTDCWAQSNFTNITADYLRNTKIRVESPGHSRMVQELVFGAGGEWIDGAFEASETDRKFLCITGKGGNLMMTFLLNSESLFAENPHKEIHLPMPPESQLPETNLETPIPDISKPKYMNKCITPQMSDAAISTLENLGYTYHGGELWRPKLTGDLDKVFGEVPGQSHNIKLNSVIAQQAITEAAYRNRELYDYIPSDDAEFKSFKPHEWVTQAVNLALSLRDANIVKPIYTREMQERGELPPVGCKVEIPSGYGIVAINKPDVNGIVIVESTSGESKGEYKRVALSAIKPTPTPQEKLAEQIFQHSGIRARDGGKESASDIAKAILDGEIPGFKYEGGEV